MHMHLYHRIFGSTCYKLKIAQFCFMSTQFRLLIIRLIKHKDLDKLSNFAAFFIRESVCNKFTTLENRSINNFREKIRDNLIN